MVDWSRMTPDAPCTRYRRNDGFYECKTCPTEWDPEFAVQRGLGDGGTACPHGRKTAEEAKE